MMDWVSEYINQIKSFEVRSLYIYGAGKIGKLIYGICREHGIKISGFCVTDKKGNAEEVEGLKVYSLDEIKGNPEETLFLIAIMERGGEKIKNFLKEKSWHKVISMPDFVLELDPWEQKRRTSPIIEATPKIGCLVNCRYCPQSDLLNNYYILDKSRKSVMSFDEYKVCLDKMPDNTIVDFSGFVEPFLNEDAVLMMEYTHEKGHEMTLYTTLRGLSVKDADRVLKLPFKEVVLHTPDIDGYADIPITEEYKEVLKGFVQAGVITEANCQSKPLPLVLDILGNMKVYCEMSDRAGNLDEEDEYLSHANVDGEIFCDRAPALNHNVLLPDGTLVLCCNDFGLKHPIGNLLEQSYEEIMSGETMRDLKRAMHIDTGKSIICRKCIFAKKISQHNHK